VARAAMCRLDPPPRRRTVPHRRLGIWRDCSGGMIAVNQCLPGRARHRHDLAASPQAKIKVRGLTCASVVGNPVRGRSDYWYRTRIGVGGVRFGCPSCACNGYGWRS